MDGYLAKPVRAAELLQAIADLVPSNIAGQKPEPRLERSTLLAQFDGDVDLLRDLASLFVDQTTQAIAEARAALARGDPESLRRFAHNLVGSAGYVQASGLAQCAAVLEKLAADSNLSGAAEALASLEREFERVRPSLIELAEEVAA